MILSTEYTNRTVTFFRIIQNTTYNQDWKQQDTNSEV